MTWLLEEVSVSLTWLLGDARGSALVVVSLRRLFTTGGGGVTNDAPAFTSSLPLLTNVVPACASSLSLLSLGSSNATRREEETPALISFAGSVVTVASLLMATSLLVFPIDRVVL